MFPDHDSKMLYTAYQSLQFVLELACDLCNYLVSVRDHTIRELSGHQLVQHDTEGVDV